MEKLGMGKGNEVLEAGSTNVYIIRVFARTIYTVLLSDIRVSYIASGQKQIIRISYWIAYRYKYSMYSFLFLSIPSCGTSD